MRSNIKLLIAVTIAAVVLAAAVILLVNLTGGDKGDAAEETTSVTVNEGKLLYDKDPAAIETIAIANSEGEYTIRKYADDSWFVEDFAGLIHDTTFIGKALEYAASFAAATTANEHADDLSVYGLDAPRATALITFEDGTVREIRVGNEAPADEVTYCTLDGTDTVYAVDNAKVSYFLRDKFYFLEKTVYTPQAPENAENPEDYTKINSITVKRKDIDYAIVLEYDERQDSDEIVTGNSATHRMTEPVRLDLNPDTAYDALNAIFGLTASGVAVAAPSEETLSSFGFDDPYAVIDFDIVGGDTTLTVGNAYTNEETGEKGRYVTATGFDEIFMFTDGTLPWLTITPEGITSPLITSTYIFAIDEFTVESRDVRKDFVLSGDKDDFAVTCDGEEVDPDLFKSFYQYFLKAPAEEIYLEENTDPADVTVTVVSDYGTDIVEFINSADRLSVVRLNGRTSFRLRTTYVNRLLENLDHLMNGEGIIVTW
ncbi:MAG: DUF4340 domain-containing protein [Oscillospiraceae bacterium]|nr:DUF4340 domain-containing protein [Oscillospiraceae bacterium]